MTTKHTPVEHSRKDTKTITEYFGVGDESGLFVVLEQFVPLGIVGTYAINHMINSCQGEKKNAGSV